MDNICKAFTKECDEYLKKFKTLEKRRISKIPNSYKKSMQSSPNQTAKPKAQHTK